MSQQIIIDLTISNNEESRKRHLLFNSCEISNKVPKIVDSPILDLECQCFKDIKTFCVSESFIATAEIDCITKCVEEVYKHANGNTSQSNLCYGTKKTTCLIIRRSLESHLRSILKLEELLQLNANKKFFISTERSIPICAYQFTKTLKDFYSSSSQFLMLMKNPSTQASIQHLIIHLKSHLSTLNIYNGILLNVSTSSADKQN